MAFRFKPPVSGPIPKKRQRPKREKEDKSARHLVFVRSLPCVASGVRGAMHAHHILIGRYSQTKAPDWLTVPLCPELHIAGPHALHHVGEARFWNAFGIDPFALAAVLWEHSGDHARCVAEVMAARAAGTTRLAHQIKLFDEKEAA